MRFSVTSFILILTKIQISRDLDLEGKVFEILGDTISQMADEELARGSFQRLLDNIHARKRLLTETKVKLIMAHGKLDMVGRGKGALDGAGIVL